jgi:hypothetical protein
MKLGKRGEYLLKILLPLLIVAYPDWYSKLNSELCIPLSDTEGASINQIVDS